MISYKQLTCVACHPTEAIVATGNALGEVMIWWNLTSASSEYFGDAEFSDDSDSDEEADPHFSAIKANASKAGETGWRLLRPKRVKRSGMHWHASAVTALAFTSEGKPNSYSYFAFVYSPLTLRLSSL